MDPVCSWDDLGTAQRSQQPRRCDTDGLSAVCDVSKGIYTEEWRSRRSARSRSAPEDSGIRKFDLLGRLGGGYPDCQCARFCFLVCIVHRTLKGTASVAHLKGIASVASRGCCDLGVVLKSLQEHTRSIPHSYGNQGVTQKRQEKRNKNVLFWQAGNRFITTVIMYYCKNLYSSGSPLICISRNLLKESIFSSIKHS